MNNNTISVQSVPVATAAAPAAPVPPYLRSPLDLFGEAVRRALDLWKSSHPRRGGLTKAGLAYVFQVLSPIAHDAVVHENYADYMSYLSAGTLPTFWITHVDDFAFALVEMASMEWVADPDSAIEMRTFSPTPFAPPSSWAEMADEEAERRQSSIAALRRLKSALSRQVRSPKPSLRGVLVQETCLFSALGGCLNCPFRASAVRPGFFWCAMPWTPPGGSCSNNHLGSDLAIILSFVVLRLDALLPYRRAR